MVRNKRKIFAAVSAVTLSAAILLSGTFAWQSISQTAKNEVQGAGINPGGRLHDDFNGEIKKVYVENFGEEDIFARIRLDEYMEFGEGAGLKTGDAGYDSKDTTTLGTGDINDPSTWTPHKPGASVEDCDTTDPGFHDYFKWTMGGKTWYMPTFDKNKDSLDADINGTLKGTGTGTPYDDYIEYKSGDKESGNAEYDADDNTVQDENITTAQEEHTAAETLEATVITMAQWIEDGRTPGNYWVYDVDGWAYWAQPIKPRTATGLLLASIEQIAEPDEDWYYSINAVAQFATAGDWGDKVQGTGFYEDGMTENGEHLLNKVADRLATSIEITVPEEITDDSNRVKPGKHYNLSAVVKNGDKESIIQDITWSLSGSTAVDNETRITQNGYLYISGNEPKGTTLTVTVKAENLNGDPLTETVSFTVRDWELSDLMSAPTGTITTITIDGTEFYLLAQNGDQRLIWAKNSVQNSQFGSNNQYEGSNAQSALTAWLDSQSTLKGLAQGYTIYTRAQYNSQKFVTSANQKVFLLSEADLFGTFNGGAAQPNDYTYNETQLVAADNPVRSVLLSSNENCWLRSPSSMTDSIGYVTTAGSLGNNYYGFKGFGLRPALWINLAS